MADALVVVVLMAVIGARAWANLCGDAKDEVRITSCGFGYCPLRLLPDKIETLTGLRELHLQDCTGQTAMPAEIGALTGLEELHLDRCTGLTALPAELGALTRLRELHLEGCTGLTALPDEIEALTGLRELHLKGCTGLTALPLVALTRAPDWSSAFYGSHCSRCGIRHYTSRSNYLTLTWHWNGTRYSRLRPGCYRIQHGSNSQQYPLCFPYLTWVCYRSYPRATIW